MYYDCSLMLKDISFDTGTRLFAQLATVTLSVLYLFGFSIVSLYLAGYGIHSVALLRIQYIAAGFFSLGPILLVFLAGSLFRLGRYDFLAWSGVRPAFLILCRLLMVFVTASLATGGIASPFLAQRDLKQVFWLHLGLFLKLIAYAMLPMLGTLWMLRTGQASSKHDTRPPSVSFSVASSVTFSLFFFLAYMNFFARQIYGGIPFSVGGGAPQPVVFLLKGDSNGSALPLIADQSGRKSVPYQLVLETEKSYAVLSNSSSEAAIVFNRDGVQGYVLLPPPWRP
jgi:hypothetical protein